MMLDVLHVNGKLTIMYRKNFLRTRYVNLYTCGLPYITHKTIAREVQTNIVDIVQERLTGLLFPEFDFSRV